MSAASPTGPLHQANHAEVSIRHRIPPAIHGRRATPHANTNPTHKHGGNNR
jgi:hypothetical protein